MKNKFIWLPVALVVVAVVGAAVWFGNAQTQKGSFSRLSVPSSPATTCGNSWKGVLWGTFSPSSLENVPISLDRSSGNLTALQSHIRSGCDVKFVYIGYDNDASELCNAIYSQKPTSGQNWSTVTCEGQDTNYELNSTGGKQLTLTRSKLPPAEVISAGQPISGTRVQVTVYTKK